MTVEEMLQRISSREITDWAAIFSIEDEENEKANNGKGSNNSNDDITDDLKDAIDRDREERGL